MIDLIKVGRKINSLRSDNNMSQDQLANTLYVSRQAVSKWENGLAAPTVDNLIELSKLFGVSFETLLALDGSPQTLSAQEVAERPSATVLRGILNGDYAVVLHEVFCLFSTEERFLLIKAVKNGKLACDLPELWAKMSEGERAFLTRREK